MGTLRNRIADLIGPFNPRRQEVLRREIVRQRDMQAKLATEAIEGQLSTPVRSIFEIIHPYDPLTVAYWEQFSRGYFDEDEIKQFVKAIEGYTLATYDGLMELANEVRYARCPVSTGISSKWEHIRAAALR